MAQSLLKTRSLYFTKASFPLLAIIRTVTVFESLVYFPGQCRHNCFPRWRGIHTVGIHILLFILVPSSSRSKAAANSAALYVFPKSDQDVTLAINKIN